MKRFTFTVVLLFVLFYLLPIYAQEIYVGVKGGFNFADFDLTIADEPSSDHDVQSQTLFAAGGVFGITLNKLISIQLEPMYMRKGGVYTEPSQPDMNVETSHLELPLLFKVGIGEKIRPYILAGTAIGFVLDSHLETEMAGLRLEGDLNDILNKTEFGALLGVGLSLPVWKGSVFIEGRYAMGFSNLNKGGSIDLTVGDFVIPGPDTDPEDELKTTGVQIMVGYQLSLGGK